MAQQTAVEFLVEKLYELGHFYYVQQTELIEDAKKMEKDQIITSYLEGARAWPRERNAEQYYNETYGE